MINSYVDARFGSLTPQSYALQAIASLDRRRYYSTGTSG